MKAKRVTVEQVMAWGPCHEYTRERVKRLFGRRKYMTARDIAKLDIPPADRIWAMLHEELIDERTMRLFGCREAELLLRAERRAGREPDERSWNAIRVSRRYARGKATDEELAAASAAAGDAWAAWTTADAAGAAWATACAAARATARAAWTTAGAGARATARAAWATAGAAARRAAASDAAWAAASDVAWAAAGAGARANARAAYREKQVARLVKMIGGDDE